MIPEIAIGSAVIADGGRPFVIAEIGVNHNGSLELAREMVIAARDAGADCAKFQTFRADRVATAAAPKARYQLRTTSERESQVEMLRGLELPEAYHRELMALCAELGLVFLSTPYSIEDMTFLAELGAPALKIASALLVEPALMRAAARTGLPVIASTGMATLAEVDEAVQAFRDAGGRDLVLLQCTTDYPAPVEDANLRAMALMRDAFGVPVGYSDHTRGAAVAIASVALGACVIEKHFTTDKTLPGPDQATSDDPEEFRAMADAVRDAWRALGSGRKEPAAAERPNIVGMRRSLCAARDIAAGSLLDASAVVTKRPASGIAPREIDHVIGARARIDIAADSVLEWWMLDVEQPVER
ncbi:MAG TPA: N-acetylneuraminate synthase family protein [Candidatus Limnocylindrales bacterium]|nr:N-acetylneuraminate synthase family protein [Candidatus Limnocylindrales bacterium]